MGTIRFQMSVIEKENKTKEEIEDILLNDQKGLLSFIPSLPDVVEVNKTRLVISEDANHYPDPKWPAPEYMFDTDSSYQFLMIDIIKDPSVSKRNFFFYRMIFQCPHMVLSSHYSIDGDKYKKLSNHDDAINEDAISLFIIFGIKRKEKPRKLHVFYREGREIYYADPQVGNGPPTPPIGP